jgi:Domain of unknown function (DUF3786)
MEKAPVFEQTIKDCLHRIAHFTAKEDTAGTLGITDADEDFPAQATLLFQKDTASYLEMECLALIGGSPVRFLRK